MKFKSIRILSTSALLTASLFSCGKQTTQSSDILVTDVAQSEVKRQSIGNCWLYATASWAESMHLAATKEELNLSESYWTYWYFYDQIVDSGISKIQTGGSWYAAVDIIRNHGWVLEGDFIAGEAKMEMSAAQARAESFVNQALSTGALAKTKDRTAANVRSVLDQAFGAKMASAEKVARKASDLVVGKEKGKDLTLADMMLGGSLSWSEVRYPRVYGKDTKVSSQVSQQRASILKRVMHALNDKRPVIMSFQVDFNALDSSDATFKVSTLKAAGHPGHQGGHMVVLEDYTVDHVPGVGSIGEGDVSQELKDKALLGITQTLVAKNSWGKNRPDRGLTDGYTRFEMEYLNAQLEWTDEGSTSGEFYTTLTDFVLPKGY